MTPPPGTVDALGRRAGAVSGSDAGRVAALLRSLVTAVLLLLVGTVPATVHGDPGPDDTANATDEAFLAALHAAGLKYGQPDQAVRAGRALCDLADNGKSDDEILAILVKHNTALSDARANKFMDIAYQAYCPRYLP